jgi:hypothetical protein
MRVRSHTIPTMNSAVPAVSQSRGVMRAKIYARAT